MASFNIHLAVAKRYVEKSNSIKNLPDFYRGTIEPDLVGDKKTSHYSKAQDKANLLEYLANKVQLNVYLKDKKLHLDYEKGVFLHLVTDYLFFNIFFKSNYLRNITYEDFCKDLYFSYDLTNKYLQNKYKIDYQQFSEQINKNIDKDIKEKNMSNEKRKNILPLSQLDEFIEQVASINLEQYKNKILMANGNVLP